MGRSVTVSVTYTPDDALRVAKWIKSQSFLYRNDWWVSALIVFCSFIAMILFLANDPARINFVGAVIFSAIPAVVLGLVVVLLHMALYPWIMRRRIAKHFHSSAIVKEETRLVFSDEGIHIENPLISSETKWAAIVKCVETDSDILFYLDRSPSWYLPKYGVAFPGELDTLREILSDSLNGKVELQ